MKEKLSFSSYTVIGVMLFALFFGAGNLIFPAQLGQNAGTNMWPAIIGFLITGVGLPLLGILAMSISGSNNLQELASRIHPLYATIFTSMLYLTIGPFFAAPRTGTVAYDVGISPFVGESYQQVGLLIFTLLFFAITLWFSLNPAKIVDNVGKILAPGIVILIVVLLAMVVIKPMGVTEPPEEGYRSGAFIQGFLEGYNTMDALASLVFGIIVIKAIRAMGVTSKRGILIASAKSGLVAITLLGVIYVGIAYLGATSVSTYGIFSTGGPVLSSAASHYFGMLGTVLLAIIITLACLTTSIGLTTACAEYFQQLFPKFSYKQFVVFFSVLTFGIANFGLTNIINYSIPVLMFLYPLAIVLMLLAFLSPIFKDKRLVYVSATIVTFLVSAIDGLKTLCGTLGIDYFSWMVPIISFYENVLPLYEQGLGWLLPAIIVILITGIVARFQKLKTVQA
ncbi:branched-chain amino acid transport system II carrier protein [Virgibacillus halodenitrificans]|uniref:branched-chain amino acid transport system II carrier protein n=1 Tax=Virgibacillus halodenitrificans TaxID=1482 RepID=UPI0013691953|nr:branched-chain amino acid transport system II carrier protein [Virgibacillus halodenitrificans]MCJ0930228.1 branched-chain amino acid transport system II carrier protein [Virgibacillus halodenitrificans]MEC2159223.1 branched-chain amino acid transport system II carrier protein [Virgibacillus halodenitrificans]MYL47083.1 branched-chain amino acid transport system II carrier protein [Virgibacillus halodenitrificans]